MKYHGNFAKSFPCHFFFISRENKILTGRNCLKTSVSTAGLDYLPRTNLAEVSNNDESIMNIQRIREFVRTLSIMDICWLIPDRLDVFAFKTVGKCWSAKFRASVLNSFPDKIEPFKRLLTFPMLWSNTMKSIRDIYIYIRRSFSNRYRIIEN